jgi:hypothetical protein
MKKYQVPTPTRTQTLISSCVHGIAELATIPAIRAVAARLESEIGSVERDQCWGSASQRNAVQRPFRVSACRPEGRFSLS